MNAWFERVARQAVTLKPSKILLTFIALPFYVLGLVIGVLVVAGMFALSSVKVGIADLRAKATPTEVT